MKLITRKLSERAVAPLARRAYGLDGEADTTAAVAALTAANPFAAADLAATAVGTVLVVPEAPPLTTGPDARPPTRLAADAVLAAHRALQEVRDERQALADRRALVAAETLNFINLGGITTRPPNFASPGYLESIRSLFSARANDTTSVRQASNFGFPVLQAELDKLLGPVGTDRVVKLRLRRFSNRTDGPVPGGEIRLTVPQGFKILGGGARVEFGAQPGNYLTALFPESPTTWVARMKSHIDPSSGVFTLSAIVLDDPDDQFEVRLYRATSGLAARPTASVSVDPGFVVTGGGAELRTDGPGAFLTATHPVGTTGWTASGQEHGPPSPATITTHAVGLRPRRGRPTALQLVEFTSDATQARIAQETGLNAGQVLVGGGARLNPTTAAGSLLSTTASLDAANGWFAAGKEHRAPSPASITVFMLVTPDAEFVG